MPHQGTVVSVGRPAWLSRASIPVRLRAAAADRLIATLGANATSGFTYDTHGNTTGYTNAGITTHLAYDGADRNLQLSTTTTTGGTTGQNATISYTRDTTL